MKKNNFSFTVLVIGMVCLLGFPSKLLASDTLRQQCLRDLEKLLVTEKKWVKVHVAEYLIWLGYPQRVLNLFADEDRQYGALPQYRIGIWRVLYQCSLSTPDKKSLISRMMACYQDPNGPDREHAVETLAKLKYSTLAFQSDMPQSPNENHWATSLYWYEQWSKAYTNEQAYAAFIQQLFISLLNRNQFGHPTSILSLQAYLLRNAIGLNKRQWERLCKSGLEEENGEIMLSSLYANATKKVNQYLYRRLRSELWRQASKVSNKQLMEILLSVAKHQNQQDFEYMFSWYDKLSKDQNPGYDPDLHAAAAYALITLIDKNKKPK